MFIFSALINCLWATHVPLFFPCARIQSKVKSKSCIRIQTEVKSNRCAKIRSRKCKESLRIYSERSYTLKDKGIKIMLTEERVSDLVRQTILIMKQKNEQINMPTCKKTTDKYSDRNKHKITRQTHQQKMH